MASNSVKTRLFPWFIHFWRWLVQHEGYYFLGAATKENNLPKGHLFFPSSPYSYGFSKLQAGFVEGEKNSVKRHGILNLKQTHYWQYFWMYACYISKVKLYIYISSTTNTASRRECYGQKMAIRVWDAIYIYIYIYIDNHLLLSYPGVYCSHTLHRWT
jgi:hypothetical protein